MVRNKTEGEILSERGIAPLDIARHFAHKQFPGINESEAIAYARGIAKGMVMAGMKDKSAMRQMMDMEGFTDKLLGAGNSFMGINIIESMIQEKQ